jgi:hypothetical protein
MKSISSGMPLLRKGARADGPARMAEINRNYAETLTLVPER